MHTPRTLVFSQRNIYEQEVWRCAFREFEGIIQEIDSVELIAPTPRTWYHQGKRLALRTGEYLRTPLNPGIPEIRLTREYDLFFAVCEKPSELLNVNAVKGWRERCQTSVCWLPEFYVKDIPTFKSSLEVLSRFDHVIFMFAANEPFAKFVSGRGCYLPAGIDALRFCPYPDPPVRSIDVLSIGRRSEDTHRALLQMAEEDGLFYVYDTIDNLRAYSLAEHRSLIANLAKRSRYFIVNPGKINAPEETGGQIEFGYRYFEGAAPGAILIGDRPRNKEFDRVFNWDDAVIDLPFGATRIREVIKDMDAQPERQQRARTNNVIQSLMHHDWAYRWEAVLTMAELEPVPALLRRKERLRDLAGIIGEKQVV